MPHAFQTVAGKNPETESQDRLEGEEEQQESWFSKKKKDFDRYVL